MYLQYLNADAESIVLMEDKREAVFVVVGEYSSLDYTLDRFSSTFRQSRRMVRVVLKACTHPHLLLPYPVVNNDGKVVCHTLGEAYAQKLPMW
jgi:hypothetical protein